MFTLFLYCSRGGLDTVRVRIPLILEKVSRSKRLSCNASHQEVSRCRIRDESEESIACRPRGSQARDPPWLWKSGQRSAEVRNRGISGPTKRTHVLQDKFAFFGKIILL